MSTIGRISNSTLSQTFKTDTRSTGKAKQESGLQPQSPAYRGGGIIIAVQKALNKMGLNSETASISPEAESSSNTNGIAAGITSNGQKALYKFLHSLFTVMQDQSNATSNLAAYTPHMTASIQDIIQALQSSKSTDHGNISNSDNTSHQNLGLGTLQTDFQSLMTALGKDAATGSSQDNLLTFLQNLEDNLNQQGNTSINVLNAIA